MMSLGIILSILQSFSISLGVGSSTIAIVNFFVALKDGTFSADERKMMGVVYVVLRVAMVAILITTVALFALSGFVLTPFVTAQLFIMGVLFLNAVLMTAHVMPKTLGPALQAGSWYTLGTLAALLTIDRTDFTLVQFLLAYAAWVALAVAIVNGLMASLKKKRPAPTAPAQ